MSEKNHNAQSQRAVTESSAALISRPRATASLADIQVISFDLDDTLWDCAPAIERAEQALWQWMSAHTPRITERYDHVALHQFWQQVRINYAELTGCVTALRTAGIRQLLRDSGYSEALAEEAFEVFFQARSEVDLYPGALDLLQRLSERYRLAAITNGNADLDKIGIAHFFEQILRADLTLKAKPHAQMFDRCLEHFSAHRQQMLHVGDNPVADMQGGLDAGVQTLWFNQHRLTWSQTIPGPHFEVQTLSGVSSLLL